MIRSKILSPIYDVIPRTWTVKFSNGSNVNVRNAFIEAQQTEYSSLDSLRISEAPRPVKYSLYWFWDSALKNQDFTWTTQFILRIFDSSGRWWDRAIIDQQSGRGAEWDFNSVSLPLRFDFYLSKTLDVSGIQLVPNIGAVYIGTVGNRDVYPNGERWAEVFLHNWRTGRGLWADNRDWDACGTASGNTACASGDRIHKVSLFLLEFLVFWCLTQWNMKSEATSSYQLGLELVRKGSTWPLGEGGFEITFVEVMRRCAMSSYGKIASWVYPQEQWQLKCTSKVAQRLALSRRSLSVCQLCHLHHPNKMNSSMALRISGCKCRPAMLPYSIKVAIPHRIG